MMYSLLSSHKIHVTLSAIAAVAVLVLPPNVASGANSSAAAQSIKADEQQPSIADIASALDQYASTAYPSEYGGIALERNGAAYEVSVTTDDPDMKEDLRSKASVPIDFVIVPKSKKVLDELHDAVIAAYPKVQDQGIVFGDFWADYATGVEQIGVEDLTAEKRATVSAIFAGDPINMFDISKDSMPVFTADRSHDDVPWNGGDAIWSPTNGEACSSGWAIQLSGANGYYQRNLTAAHCFDVNDNIRNAFCQTLSPGVSCPSSGDNKYMGSVGQRDTSANGLDTEFFSGQPSGYTWTVPPLDEDPVNTTSNVTGMSVCNEGAYSGQVCAITVQSGGTHCINPAGSSHIYCHEFHAQTTGGDIANESGDSGGPILYYSNGYPYAAGTVSASGSAHIACDHHTDQVCYTDLYYVPINQILDEWNATLYS